MNIKIVNTPVSIFRKQLKPGTVFAYGDKASASFSPKYLASWRHEEIYDTALGDWHTSKVYDSEMELEVTIYGTLEFNDD